MSKLPMTINCPNEECEGTIDIDPVLIKEGHAYTCATCGETVGVDNSEQNNKDVFTEMVKALKDKKK